MSDADRALSIKQPWAWAITDLDKRVENRSRATKFRGHFWLHASAKLDADGLVALAALLDVAEVEVMPDDFLLGSIVGRAELVECIAPGSDIVRVTADGMKQGRWRDDGSHWWILHNVEALPEPVPAKGMLGFWPVPPDVLAKCEEQLDMAKGKTKPKRENKTPEPGGAHAELGYVPIEDDQLTTAHRQKIVDLSGELVTAVRDLAGAEKRKSKAAKEATKHTAAVKAIYKEIAEVRSGNWTPPLKGME